MTEERKPFSERRKGQRRKQQWNCIKGGEIVTVAQVGDMRSGIDRRKAERPASGSTPDFKFTPPRYDEVFEEGMKALDAEGSTGSVTGSGVVPAQPSASSPLVEGADKPFDSVIPAVSAKAAPEASPSPQVEQVTEIRTPYNTPPGVQARSQITWREEADSASRPPQVLDRELLRNLRSQIKEHVQSAQAACKHADIVVMKSRPYDSSGAPSYVCKACGKADWSKWSGYTLSQKQNMFGEGFVNVEEKEFLSYVEQGN